MSNKGFCDECFVPIAADELQLIDFSGPSRDPEIRCHIVGLVHALGRTGVCKTGRPEVNEAGDKNCGHEHAVIIDTVTEALGVGAPYLTLQPAD